MLYDYFVTSDRVNRYPAYMDKEMRLALKQKMREEKLSLYCSCSFLAPVKLEYGISVDGKIYPLHQGYEHTNQCIRSSGDKRKSAYVVQDDGTAKVYLGFNVGKFTIPTIKEQADDTDEDDTDAPASAERTEEESSVQKETSSEAEKKQEKEPTDTLSRFILELNNDTYHERITAGKGLISADYFQLAINGRLKKVYIDGFNKPLKDLTVNEDGLQFFYQPLSGIDTSKGTRVVFKGWKGDFSTFAFDATVEKEKKNFKLRYGIELEEALMKYHVMAAGFVYLRMSKRQTLYRVVGRIHFFVVNENGLYCQDLDELEELNAVSMYLKKNQRYKTILFDRVVDDPKIWGIFSKVGKKQVIVCKPKVPARIPLNGPDHVAFSTQKLCQDDFLTIERIFM